MTRREFLTQSLTAIAASSSGPLLWFRSSPSALRIERLASDHTVLTLAASRRFRILQLTDTHFGTPTDENREKDARTRVLIRTLVDQVQPDLVFHTGDFINNDREGVEFSALDFMNDLGTPWGLTFGNHDHPNGKTNNISLDAFFGRMENHVSGYAIQQGGTRDYCSRIDLRVGTEDPFASIFTFNTGYPHTGMVVSPSQHQWFLSQLERDQKRDVACPIVVMQHIPTVEYHELFESSTATGTRSERVCFELDMGVTFRHFQNSQRVKGVFVGHDHVNDYWGDWRGVRLAYGRVSGWSGYGHWQRGGRLIDADPATRRFRTRVVLPAGVEESPSYSRTHIESEFPLVPAASP